MLPLKIDKKQNIEEIINNSLIDLDKEIARPPTILSIREERNNYEICKRIFTLGNFSVVTGKQKSKKTYLMTMFVGAVIKGDMGKLIGELPENKKLVIYIDTEQGEYDSWNCMKRIIKMSGIKENFKAFNLRPYDYRQRCEIIEKIFEIYSNELAYCVIDGVVDLVSGINSEEEATRVSEMLLRLTHDNNCHVSTIIHQNKQDNYATGHLGSAVMKKAEIVISVTKDKNDYLQSIVECNYSRGMDFEGFIMYINHEGLPEIFEGKKKQEKINYYDKIEKEQEQEYPF